MGSIDIHVSGTKTEVEKGLKRELSDRMKTLKVKDLEEKSESTKQIRSLICSWNTTPREILATLRHEII